MILKGLTAQRPNYINAEHSKCRGSFLISFTNFFAILLAIAIVFRLMGLEELGFTDAGKEAMQKAIRVIIASILLISLLLRVTTYNAYVRTTE